jgi:hypothetical protein
LGVQRGQLGCGGALGFQDRGHQPVDLPGCLRPARIRKGVLDHPHHDRVAFAPVVAADSRDRQDPSDKDLVDRQLGAVVPVLARHSSCAPVAAAARHSWAPTNNRSGEQQHPAKDPA